MLTENFEHLKKMLRVAGFPESLDDALKTALSKRPIEFQLRHRAQFTSNPIVVTLHFMRSAQSELYFFHRFDLALTLNSSKGVIKQTFQHSREMQLTLREACNLLLGRAVNKDFTTSAGVRYNAWMQLNFTRRDSEGNYLLQYYHERYGFNLEKELSKYPFRELRHATQKARLVAALKVGDRQEVVCRVGDKEEPYLIEANPHFKSLKLYDQEMRRVSYRRLMEDRPAAPQAESSSSAPASQKERRSEKKKHGAGS